MLRGQSTSGTTVATFKDKKVPAGGRHQQGIDAIGGPPPVPAVEALPDGGPKVPSTDPSHNRGIATATADVECKLSTNLVGVAVAVEIAYDRQYIEMHPAQLTEFKRRLGDQLRAAARLTGSSSA